jgi:hypothetical protein
MKLSNPTKSPTMPARTWKPANMTRAAYQQAGGGSLEFTAMVPNGMFIHLTLTDEELDALVKHREYAKARLATEEAGLDPKTWFGTSFYTTDGTAVLHGADNLTQGEGQ